ncbi:MAG TPA: beta-L-arabinofuranosidase domain-containing protein [Chloroflexota bacterium]|jgi:DUF1680 family protein|nr:beta-L-arabinofuranosidase domain-containing protein [Chloroflexota bacterium]
MAVMTRLEASPHARLRGVAPAAVRWGAGFWGQRFEQCRQVTLPHLWELMDDPQTGHALTNLRIAAGELQGEFVGTHWQDEWVYKWIEAAAYVYAVTQDAWLGERMDEAIRVIARAQAPDGYLATQTQVRGWPRFREKGHHEVYVMGHLLSAACAHFRATGKTTLLDVARKTGDFLHRTFYPQPAPELAHIVFNPSHIMGLVELYRATGERRYVETAGACIDMFGAAPGGTDQTQDRVPLREETQVVGHMVLATYLYAGATDAYLETGDETLLRAVERLWADLVGKRLYVHGGVCAVHRGFSIRPREVAARQAVPGSAPPAGRMTRDGYPGHLVHRHLDDVHEAAGDDYELPNSTGYNETCAQIGNVLWNWRLLAASAQARHAELVEHTLYNGVVSGMGLDGKSWFYTNPLRFYGGEHKLLSQDAYERFQPGRVHVCCPSNLARAVAGVHGYAYSLSGAPQEGVWVNLYGASRLDSELPGGGRLALRQETGYPWEGTVRFTIEAAPGRACGLYLRVPSWAKGASVLVNRQAAVVPEPETYAPLVRVWREGDVVELALPLRTRLMVGHPRIESCRNQVSVMRGPLLYCLEGHDLPAGTELAEVYLPPDARLRPRHAPDLLGGVTVLEGEAEVIPHGTWQGTLYRELEPVTPQRRWIRLIPYYAWANRGTSEMAVWLPLSRRV